LNRILLVIVGWGCELYPPEGAIAQDHQQTMTWYMLDMPEDCGRIFRSCSVDKIGKPDPPIFHLALEKLEAAPEEAVFIDDFAHNIAGAQAVGMHAIQFYSSEQIRADLGVFLKNG
jgi:beta-phosphoglucomutase-like phosphatase (HAD superfamily)